MEELGRRLTIGIVLGAVVSIGLMAYGDLTALIHVVRRLDPTSIAIALGLSLIGYGLRFVKWEVYLKRLSIKVQPSLSALIFVSGFVMSVTPGKVGEVLKSFLLRKVHGVPVARTAPVVVAERVTDLVALLCLTSFGVVASGYGWGVFIIGFFLTAALVLGLASPGFGRWILRLLCRLPAGRRVIHRLEEAHRAMVDLMNAKVLALTTTLSILAWGCEGLGTWFILEGIQGASVSIAAAIFVFSFSTLAGALSMLPGGLVATEGSMIVLLTGVLHLVADEQTAVAATLLVRFCTLWFGVVLGGMALMCFRSLLPHGTRELSNSHETADAKPLNQ